MKLPKKANGSLNLVLDSTGLKIYGEGEWKVRKHGYSKRRTWRTLHLGADPEIGNSNHASAYPLRGAQQNDPPWDA